MYWFTFSMFNFYDVTGEQPPKLPHSLLGYAVGMADIYRPAWHTEINLNKKQLKNALPFFKQFVLTRFKTKLQDEIYFTGNNQKPKLSFTISAKHEGIPGCS